jgi:hypothetical protein
MALVPNIGYMLEGPMYVVGANLLSEHWASHPESEGELRALHALVVDSEADALPDMFERIATENGRGTVLRLRTALVRVEINAAAGILRYVAVEPSAEKEQA